MLGYFARLSCLRTEEGLPRLFFCYSRNSTQTLFYHLHESVTSLRCDFWAYGTSMRLSVHTDRDWMGADCLITLRVKCDIPRNREMKISFRGHRGAGLVIQWMRKWRFHLVAASIFSSIGQWRWNRIKQGRDAGRILQLFHWCPPLTPPSPPAPDTSFLLKLRAMLNKWVSSESLSRTYQYTSLVSKWRVFSTWRRVIILISFIGVGVTSNSERIGALCLHSRQ